MESVLYKRLSENPNYFIGNNQTIFSTKRGIFLKDGFDKDGYVVFSLSRKKIKMHRAMYSSFVAAIPEGLTVNHIDMNKKNNSINNIEVMTNLENFKHMMINQKDGESKRIGSRHYLAKLKLEDVVEILKINPVKYRHQIEVAERFGVSDCLIRDIVKGRSWKHVPRP